MPRKKRKKRLKRGFPIALLIALEEKQIYIWQIFSEAAKLLKKIELGNRRNKSKKQISEFYELIIDTIRPLLQEGERSILVSSPLKTDYGSIFLKHVKKHHAWLVQPKSRNVASFGELTGRASTAIEVRELVHTKQYLEIMNETTSKEADNIIDILEKRLNAEKEQEKFLFSFEEIEDLIFDQWNAEDLKPEFLLLTNNYLNDFKYKNRLNKLLQIAKNRHVKIKIFREVESMAGKRIASFGGIVCLMESGK